MFAMISTRPNITQVVKVVNKYMANSGREHWKTVNRILRYIRGSLDVRGYVNSEFAGDLNKRKSTISYMFTLAGGAISWVSKL